MEKLCLSSFSHHGVVTVKRWHQTGKILPKNGPMMQLVLSQKLTVLQKANHYVTQMVLKDSQQLNTAIQMHWKIIRVEEVSRTFLPLQRRTSNHYVTQMVLKDSQQLNTA